MSMDRCEGFRDQLPLLLYGELSFEDEDRLELHLAVCQRCREELHTLRTLNETLDAHEPDVPAHLLASCRRTLRTSISAIEETERSGSWAARLWRRMAPARFPWAQALAAVLLLAAGYAGGRFLPNSAVPLALPDSLQPTAGIRQQQAPVSRVRYVMPDADGNLRIVFEESRERTLSGRIDDEHIQQLLISAARSSADPGVRVETVDLLKSFADRQDVKRALLHVVRHDHNPGVRLKALEGLRRIPSDNDTRRALTEVLLQDNNAGVRTQVIDMVTQRMAPDMVGVLQEVMLREDNSYVRSRCQKALHEMKASVDTF